MQIETTMRYYLMPVRVVVQSLSCVRLFATPWTAAHQASLSFNISQSLQTHVHWVGDAAAAAKSLQSCLTLCDPIDGSPSGSTIPGILQARTLEWVAISFSNAWKWKVKVKSESEVTQSSDPQWPHGLQPTGLLRPWDSPGKRTGVGCHCLLRGNASGWH